MADLDDVVVQLKYIDKEITKLRSDVSDMRNALSVLAYELDSFSKRLLGVLEDIRDK